MDMIDEFRDTAARLFTDFATAETLEAAERGTLPLDLWNAVNESGFGLVLVPEAHGGIGAGLREAAAILNAAGEHAVPGPLLELMLGNQMLALARSGPQAGSAEVWTSVDLCALLEDAASLWLDPALARGVDLGFETQPAQVLGSAWMLHEMLGNLIHNAIRHTPRGGHVEVSATTDGTHAVLSVRDSCGGIPSGEIDRVFDLAFRGDAARTPGDGGGGFGLAIARGLVEAHRGDIAVANEDDGCRFTVRLPPGS